MKSTLLWTSYTAADQSKHVDTAPSPRFVATGMTYTYGVTYTQKTDNATISQSHCGATRYWEASSERCPGLQLHFVQAKGYDPLAPEIFMVREKSLAAHAHRLSDPDCLGAVAGHIAELATSRESALKFLENIGVASSDGRLTKAFGG